MIEITITKMPYGYNFFCLERKIDAFYYGKNKKQAIKEFREEAKLKNKKIKFIYVEK